MGLITLKEFQGIFPRIGITKLPELSAQIAQNVRLNAKNLQPWYQATEEEILKNTGLIKTIFLYQDLYWFEWTADVDIVLGILAADESGKAYYTGHGIPKKTNATLATTGAGPKPVKFYPMGMPVPRELISAANTGGGSGDDRYIQYLWTVISVWSEESSPSLAMASALLAKQGDVINLSNITMKWEALTAFSLDDWVYPTASEGGTYVYKCVQAGISAAAEPAPWGTTLDGDTTDGSCLWRCFENNLAYKRIYRFNTGNETANYQFLKDIAISSTTAQDTGVLDVDLGTDISDVTYDPPPDAMKGICYMGNGICVGFSGKDLYFSVPYKPWAYPIEYQKTIPIPIVGLVPIGEAVVVATEGKPYIANGNDPSAISVTPIPYNLACVAKRGCTAWGVIAIIPTTDGLYAVTAGQNTNITKEHFDTKTWAEIVPNTFQAYVWDNKYIAFYSYGATEGALVVDLLTGNITKFDFYSNAIHVHPKTGSLFYVWTPEGELMPNLVDRDFSGPSAWANVDLNAYDETGDLTITATVGAQYCTLPVASAPMSVGRRYRLAFDVANLVSTWTIKSFDGVQTFGTVTTPGAKALDFEATALGGIRIVAGTGTSSGDFDNFSLTDITNCIYQWEGDTTLVYGSYEWQTKDFLFPYKKNVKAARIIFESNDLTAYLAQVEAYNSAVSRNKARISALLGGQSIGDIIPGTPVSLGGDLLEALPTLGAYSGNDTLTFKVYVDDVLRATRIIYDSDPFLLGVSRRGRKWSFAVNGNVVVERIDIADSIQELMEGQ